MESQATRSSGNRHAATDHPAFPPLEDVNRPTVPTNQAGYYLDRRPQTLRGWACKEDGPFRPMRINGRLAWPVADIKRLLGVQQ
ncbi:hypothetical protein QN397_15635 [Variovorax sp. RTB1]|uniref:hypothetical protein n=1 Tax=Variovorax sp. RTB1 TaxID=3048631 RepID=UPI002B23D150|nr:hypothetical protein [Variovorax sp. RTB1]MEB0112789.1 hypothetical protein [Variovorax sp. RTB1]